MDTSRMSQGQMVAAVGGVLLVIALFISWEEGASAFDIFSGMDIIMLIIAIVAIVWGASSGLGAATPAMLSGLLVGVLGVVVLGFSLGFDLEAGDADIGAWLALVASIAIAWGGLGAPRRTVAGPSSSTAAPPPPPAAPAA
jgi:hypothetical protein